MEQEKISIPSKEDVLIEYVKEKDSLKAEMKEKDKEIQRQKAKIYDLQEKLDELKKEMQTLNGQRGSSNKLTVARPQTGRARTPSISKRSKSAKQKSQKSSTKLSQNSAQDSAGVNARLDSETNQEILKQRIEHLEEVAKRYPELKLSVILESERFFNEGDINHDGTIDEEELEKLLTKQGHLFTNKELKEIMTQIDVDNNQAIDMMEYLAVMERVQQRKRVNLPSAITKSAACAIQ